MKEFRPLIFDVDGAMAEMEELHRCAYNESFEHFGLKCFWEADLYRTLLAVTGGRERIAHFQDAYADDGTRMNSGQTSRYADLVARGSCMPRSGVLEIIATATATSRDSVGALLALVLGPAWQALFHVIVAGEHFATKKPAPDAYLKVLEALGLPPGSCLAFEDSRNGLLAAQLAGIAVVITRSTYFGHEEFDSALRVERELSEVAMQS